jgi:DinB superfamily
MPITPDTKNWTWVLERSCPECGFEAQSFARDDVGRIIRENTAEWQRILARADVQRRPRADVWSPLEYGCHIRDVYRICDGRLDLMLNETDPTFANWDQDATAIEDAYDTQDPATVSVELEAAAARIAVRFDAVSGDEWSRRGFRSDGAHFTVESFARYVVHDVAHHLVDV